MEKKVKKWSDTEKWGDINVKLLIHETNDFIIFVNTSNDLDWVTSDEFDQREANKSNDRMEVLNKIAALECKPNKHLDQEVITNFKRLLGESLSRSFSGDDSNAINGLKIAEDYIEERGKELSREWYLSSAGQLSISLLLLGITIWSLHPYLENTLGKEFLSFFYMAISGSLGALLSISLRMGNENMNHHAGKKIHELEAKYRILSGTLSGLVLSIAVSTKMILPVLSELPDPKLALLVIAFFGGMSERLVPSISQNLEKKMHDS